MARKSLFILSTVLFLVIAGLFAVAKIQSDDERFVSYIVDTKKQDLKLYWKDDKDENFKSIQNLKLWL